MKLSRSKRRKAYRKPLHRDKEGRQMRTVLTVFADSSQTLAPTLQPVLVYLSCAALLQKDLKSA
jgi:hypothetical protein